MADNATSNPAGPRQAIGPGRHTITIGPDPAYKDFLGKLEARAMHIRARRVAPSEDSLPRVTAELRAATLDLRLVGRTPTAPGKVDVAAEQVVTIDASARTQPTQYNLALKARGQGDAGGPPGPGRSGALQIVFADLGTPKPGTWNVYDELRYQLVHRGMATETIRYLHEARDDTERHALFNACRAGRVAVLITNSRRMEPDVPTHAAALHHLDCPQSANDLRRREGNVAHTPRSVRVFRYVTVGSYEPATWLELEQQTAARSAAASAFPPPSVAQRRQPAAAAAPGPVRPTPRPLAARH